MPSPNQHAFLFRSGPRMLLSALIAIPLALTATGIASSTGVSDAFRYMFSPGTMIAFRFVTVQPSHKGVGTVVDALNAYGQILSTSLVLNLLFYGLLLFAIMTLVFKPKLNPAMGEATMGEATKILPPQN